MSSSSSHSSSSSSTNTNPYASLGLIHNPDGSFTRVPEFIPATAACSDPPISIPVLTKDVPINPHTNTWARLYLPRPRRDSSLAKLPLILFFHGGGFIVASAASTLFQNFCSGLVLHLPALMLSVEYRNAPEHRLPAAYDDCMEALLWLRSAADEWLTDHADFSNCYIMGNSAGGNIALRVGLQASRRVDDLAPLRIRGLVLHQPFFGGVERFPSEIRLADNQVQDMTNIVWDLVLPIGADRDHEFSNPIKDLNLDLDLDLDLEKVISQKWRVLVTGYQGDPLVDRQIQLVKLLKDKGVSVVQDFREGGSHGIDFYDHSFATHFYHLFNNFLLAL